MKDNTLMQIANVLSVNIQKLSSPGLLEGKMGVAIFLYHYSRYSGRTAYSQLADHLLDEIIKSISGQQISFSTGLSGIGWGIKHLLKENFIEGGDDILEDLENCIVRYIKAYTNEDMLDGCVYLALCNPELLDASLMKVLEKQISIFLSSSAHSLAALNKILVFAIYTSKHLRPWSDMLPDAVMRAIDSQLYCHSDLMVCKELLKQKETLTSSVLYDKCTYILAADDYQVVGIEIVWKNLVFLGGVRKEICDIYQISTMVHDILKDLNEHDMYLASGLPAMGMDILSKT
jgi:hypothetical protein